MKRIVVVAIVLGLAMLAVPSVMANDKPQNKVSPALSAQWWEWALSIPTSHNPLLDTTGADCVVGQRGPVWFLAGTFNPPGSATRTCSLPEGKALYFPAVNAFWDNSPNVCGQGSGNVTVKEMRAWVAAYIDGITSTSVQLDGQAIDAQRVKSAVFAVDIPADNLFVQPCNGDSPAGVYSPAVDEGYYVALDPLPVGNHALHFQAQYQGETVQDITYNLIVVPVLKK
jgi:hypothetical protein